MNKELKWKRLALIAGGVVALVAIGFWLWLPANGLPTAKKFIRWQFEDVRHITPTDLAEWLADTSRTTPLLLDIRREDEFSISHLPNAKRVAPDATDEDIKEFLADSDQPIVAYCAVGYRSGKMARRIQGLGHTNVFNLEGAIFAWATEGNPLEGSDKVHPYSAFGRRMLADNLEAD
ncbi:MAG: rhodanese-like domain-containing protein [Verrucomicrobiota bacterium]|nr:rhodanese-like domain-containing protein [Verrucomicrobiota bacterium]